MTEPSILSPPARVSRQVMKNARGGRQFFRESRPVGHRCGQLLHAIVARRVRDHVGDPKPRKVSIFHVTPFGGRWRNGARTPGRTRHKFPFVHVANDVHGAKWPSIQLSLEVQKMKAELLGDWAGPSRRRWR